jgi:hypothetical protein
MTGTVRDCVLTVNFYHLHKGRFTKVVVSLFVFAGVSLFLLMRLGPLLHNPFARPKKELPHA